MTRVDQMKGFIGITDNDWFAFLSQQPGIDEVNFWQPGGQTQFRYLNAGEPFFFKLHSPQNFIVGVGFFAHSTILPVSLAWSAFGVKNGVISLSEMRSRTEKYRRSKPSAAFYLPSHSSLNAKTGFLFRPISVSILSKEKAMT
jgi:putative restriction endonuclease